MKQSAEYPDQFAAYIAGLQAEAVTWLRGSDQVVVFWLIGNTTKKWQFISMAFVHAIPAVACKGNRFTIMFKTKESNVHDD